MKPVWTPDFEVDADLARRLIKRAVSNLTVDSLVLLGTGWDNSAFLVNGCLVFRFPRRTVAADLLANEARFLPLLAPHFPLPIPSPLYVGEPTGEYPYPFAAYKQIPGTTADRVDLTDEQRSELAVPLGRFLRALHHIPVTPEIIANAPGDEIGRTNLAKRLALMTERVTRNVGRLEAHQIDAHTILDCAVILAATPPALNTPCWLHGDLYVRHLLLDEERVLCGVIDWGDVHLGDRALDLSIAYSFLPAEAREAFFSAYGDTDADSRNRARFRALNYGVILVDYGSEVGDSRLVEAGKYALEHALVLDR